MMLDTLHRYILPAAYQMLPPEMASDAATALLLAIALQESKAAHRRQVRGPARGFWQFELGGLAGVRRHEASAPHLARALAALHYPATLSTADAAAAIEHNDVLAGVYARLLLWTLPDPLPGPDDVEIGWAQYLAAWRPGKPHPEIWPAHVLTAWALVRREAQT